MAGSINKVTLLGNLGADPVVNNSTSGAKIVNLRVATTDSWKDRATGERKERTEWHRVVIFNSQLAETAEKYLRKGSKVYLEGQLQTRTWKDNSGADRYTTEVVLQNYGSTMVLLDSRNGGSDYASAPNNGDDVFSASSSGWDNSSATSPSSDIDDDIPF